MQIIPAINSGVLEEASELIGRLGDVILPNGMPLENVQIDINDGTFENIKTIAPESLSEVNTKLIFDYHLMVNDPAVWIERCLKAHPGRIIGHIEKMPEQSRFVDKAELFGVRAGFGLSIDTPIDRIDTSLFSRIDVILLVSYPAGAGGKKLEERVFEKIEKLTYIRDTNSLQFKICLDGGITLDNIKRVNQSGIDEVAISKRILVGNIEENLERFYKALY